MEASQESIGAAPLRVLIVRHALDPLADWHAMLLDRLAQDPQFELVGMLEGRAPAPRQQGGAVMRTILAVERRAVSGQIMPYDKTAAEAVLANLPVESVPQPDLALEIGARQLAPDQLRVAHHGAWSVTFGGASNGTYIATQKHQREASGMAVQILQRRSDAPDPVVVRGALYNRKPGAILTCAFAEEKSVLLVQRALRDLALGKTQGVGAPVPAPAPAQQSLGVIQSVSYAVYFASAAARRLLDNRRVRQGRDPVFWRLATGTGDLTDMNPATAADLPTFNHLMADPFLFEEGGKTWVFYEAKKADDGAGWIDVAELEGDTLKPAETALACPYHLSFPFVFRDGQDIYMLPETQQSRRLEVWRAIDFPTKWECHATAFEGMFLADSTLWKGPDEQWWLLTNLSDHHAFQDHSSELYLFAVDGPGLGGIVPHSGNPVAIGSDHARNAGALIRQKGRLFRPSQNNSFGVYGYGLNLMEVTRLDSTEFAETPVRNWTPDDRPGIVGLHHLSAAGDRYIIDWCGK